MAPDWRKQQAAIAALIASALVLIGSFGPWATFFGLSVSGTSGDGKVTLVCALIAASCLLARLRSSSKLNRALPLIAGLVLAGAALVGINDWSNLQDVGGSDNPFSSAVGVGWGLVIVTLAGAVGAVFAFVSVFRATRTTVLTMCLTLLLVAGIVGCGSSDNAAASPTPPEDGTTAAASSTPADTSSTAISAPTTRPTTAPTATTGSTTGTSRSAPGPVGKALTVGDWSIIVNSVIPNATQQVLARNSFNKPPATGEQFFMVSISATYTGSEEPAQFFSDVTLKAVGASSVGYDSQSDCGTVPDEFDEFKDTFKGGTLTGNVCWAVKTTDAGSLLMYGTQFIGKGIAWWALK